MNISQEDFGILCICALRYCHGRRSYMPSLVQEIVGRHLEEFSDKTIKAMVDDCQFQRDMSLYGDECDKIDWLKWEQKVKDEQTRRTIGGKRGRGMKNEMKPTEKQLKFIEDIQEFTGKVFNGNTKEEASKFISENIEQYKLEMEVRSLKWGYE